MNGIINSELVIDYFELIEDVPFQFKVHIDIVIIGEIRFKIHVN